MTTISDVRRGTDSSGRPLMSTLRFWKAWQAVLRHPRVLPFAARVVPVQGAFMALIGGGATASAGYHDKAGCWDVRTWNLTDAEEQTLWEVAEIYGIHFWKRDLSAAHGGMDEHGHALCLWDGPLDSGAASQRVAAINKRDGLAGNGPDYMTRKTGPVLTYPAHLITEDYMATSAAEQKLDQALELLKGLDTDLEKLTDAERLRYKLDAKRQSKRYSALVAKIGALADKPDGITRADLLKVLADEPDVTGPDNPAKKETP